MSEQVTDLIDSLFPQLESSESEKLVASSDSFFSDWERRWNQDLFQAKSGYPANGQYRRVPDLENELVEHVSRTLKVVDPRLKGRPTLCLSHDIDYLESTPQMRIKRLVSQRRLPWKGIGHNYLQSIRALLECDRFFCESSETSSTLFIAAPLRSDHFIDRAKQWLIDPSYLWDEKNLPEFKKLVGQFPVEIGLHGSYLSLPRATLSEERKILQQLFPHARLTSNRQHWLNCSSSEQLKVVHDAGFSVDSSFGWNGGVGFRGGFSRPFPIRIGTEYLWEMPLLLMDGPLFDDMKMTSTEVIAYSIQLLESIESINPTIAIDWHDRAAHSDYGWFEAYEQILGWAKKRGWLLTSIEGAMKLNAKS